MADVVLLTPREIPTGAASLNNQNVLINDEEYLSLDPAMRLFYKRVRENLGVACIAGHLRACGYSVRALNLHGRNPSDEAIVDLIRRERPQFVGISIMYDLHIIDAVRLLRCVREADPSVFVAIGGAFCTYNAKLIAERIPEA
ncbi:cobalamin B12-binding domain-containing protein, partial [Streptomyces sp. NPDC006184]|uniref:cobalamin B12-binding domain-containing protein n=2 Tax=unclassified Streptomyces TaxID=2593676 RepID=UPI0033B5266B